jgi:hypothetical protein
MQLYPKSLKLHIRHRGRKPKDINIYHVLRPRLLSEQWSWKSNWNFSTDEQIHEQFVTYNADQIPVVSFPPQ